MKNNLSQPSRAITRVHSGLYVNKNTLFQTQKRGDEVEVGSKEYLEGFISSPIQDTSERGTGLEQALKLGGSFAVILVLLFVGFMASNGLI